VSRTTDVQRHCSFLGASSSAGAPCQPQIDTRSVAGVVTDKRGNTLPGAAVQLENTITASIMSYITGKDGRYQFNNLNGDIDYTLKAKYRRYVSERKTVSKFNSSKHLEVNFVIPAE
jgi:hypothetical protein